jgi:translin
VKKELATLKAVLGEIKNDLMQKDKIRDETHESMRKATSLSKQAILLIHQKKQGEAERLVKEATEKIANLQTQAKEFPEIIFGGMFSAALQEFSEANIFLTLVKNGQFVTPKEINVPSVDYVLGLADVVGEYRRLALDALREGDAKKGEECLAIMDEIFIELLALDEAYMLVPGLRRKSDIARKIIETTRGDVTQEVRRKSLEDYLKRFESVQPKKRQLRKKKIETT